MVVEIIIYVVRDDGWHNVATHVIAVHRWNAIRSRRVTVFWVRFWLVPLVGLRAYYNIYINYYNSLLIFGLYVCCCCMIVVFYYELRPLYI